MVGVWIAWSLVFCIIIIIFIIHIIGYILTSPRPYDIKLDDEAKLQWRNICYAVKKGKKKQLLLHNISGDANPGEIIAIMGSSGCGKTTLLNILSGSTGRSTSNEYFAGQILFNNNQVISSLLLDKQCCYVYQEDNLISNFTVNEYLNFIASLLKGSQKQNKKRLKNVISLLRIDHIGNHIIGNNVFSEISGGQRRRVSLAEGLLNDCKLIFLDEPTTGLSSADAQELFTVLRDVASSGYTIIMTIHQPRQSIFSCIDKLLLMSSGQQVYFGSTKDVEAHFTFNEYPLAQEENTADSIIDILDNSKAADELIETWKTDHEYDYPNFENITVNRQFSNPLSYFLWRLRGIYILPKEIFFLTYLHIKIGIRDKWTFFIPCLVSIFIGTFNGLLFRDIPEDVDEFPNHLNAIWRIVADFTTYSVLTALYIKLRPNSDLQLLIGRYNTLSHGLLWIIRLIFLNIISALLNTGIAVLIVGWGTKTFFSLVILNFFMISFAAGFTLAMATFIGSYAGALTLNLINMIIAYSTGGYYVLPSDIIIAARWTTEIGIIHQLIDAAATIQLGDIDFNCDSTEYPDCTISGSDLLEKREFYGNVSYDFAIVIIWGIIGFIIFSIFIYVPIYKKRKLLKKRLNPELIEKLAPELAELEIISHGSIGGNNNEDDKNDNIDNSFEINESFTLGFEDVCCNTADGFQILHNVNGFIHSGEVLAVMGPSGSGKTTLLKCLSGIQNPNLYTSLRIVINNYILTKPLLQTGIATFMTQDDVIPDIVTVRECLEFVNDLRSWNISYSKREKMITTLLQQMKLSHIEHSLISQLSGGEKKRVSIAQTFLAKKKIVILDEPTSGLSGSDSRLIMDIITDYARKHNIIIIITIHQPRTSIFMEFDHLLLMSKGFPVFYGKPSSVGDFFESLNKNVPNIADAALDNIIENEISLSNIRSLHHDHKIVQFPNIQKQLENAKQGESNQKLSVFQQNTSSIPIISSLLQILCEIITLTKFYGTIQYRTFSTFKMFILQTILLALYYGLLYLQLDNTAETIPSISGGIFLLFTGTAFGANAQGFELANLIYFWVHDNMIGLYRLWTVLCVEILVSNIRIVITIILFCSITYWMVGFDPIFWKFLVQILAYHIACFWFYLVGIGICAIEWDIQVSSLVSTVYLTFCISSTGYLISLDQIPGYLTWFAAINPLRYSNELLVINEFIGQTFQCEDEDDFLGSCPVSGVTVTDFFGYDQHAYLKDVILGYSLILATFILALFGLYVKIYYRTPRTLTRITHYIKMSILKRFTNIDTKSDDYILERMGKTLNGNELRGTQNLSFSQSLGLTNSIRVSVRTV